jgi:predicted dehydrogenase
MTTISDPVRWGIVGTGYISESFVSDIAATENAVPLAVCSRSAERAGAFAERHGIAAHYSDLAQMLASPAVELVYIGTPHATHYPIAQAALRAGKHVVIEKPMALDGAQVRDLIATAARGDRFLMEGMWMKFNPAIREVQRLVAEGRIGTVRSVRAAFGLPFPRDLGSRWQAELGGSALLDEGIYPVTLARMVLGEPDEVIASGTWSAPGVDASEWMTLEYSGRRFAHLACSMVEYLDSSASINGTHGWITLDGPFLSTRAITIHSGEIVEALMAPERRQYELEGNGYVPMIRAVGEAVRSGIREHPLHLLAETVATIDLLDRIRRQLQDATQITAGPAETA